MVDQPNKDFNFLRYDDSGEYCVAVDPLLSPRIVEEGEMTFSIATGLMLTKLGSPVLCCGLKHASNLNDKLGDVRSFHKNCQFAVHFEDGGIKPTLVKLKNLYRPQ